MAITVKPKQALGFLDPRNCICNSPYCQPYLTTDSLMLQGTVDSATGSNMVNDGEFDASTNWQLGAGWSIAGGKLVATNISGTTAQTIAPIGYQVGRVYLIQIQVTVTSAGSAGAGQGYIITANGDYLQLPDSTALGDGYNQSMTASWIYSPTAITQDDIEFSTNENTIDFEVSYVRVYELSTVGLAVVVDGVVTDSHTTFTGDNFLKYYLNGELFIDNGSLVGGITNLLFESATTPTLMWELFISTWESVTSETGCLTVRIFDTFFFGDLIRNGSFTSGDLTYWTAGAGWTFTGPNFACYSSGAGITSLSQTVTMLGGTVYNLSLDVSGASGSESVVVTYSINGGAPVTAVQNFVYLIDLSAEATELLSVQINIRVNDAATTLCVTNIVLEATEADDLLTSNCLNIQTEHPCTLLFYAINLDNAFGLDYTSGSLQHWLRVYGKIKYLGYPEEVDVFKFSDNSNELMFASSEKEFEVIIGDAPEQIHDCIAILRLHDIFQIDGTEYVRSGTYDINRRRSSDNSQAIFSVKESQGVSSNYTCN